MNELVRVADGLSRQLRRLRFGQPVTHVYNPLEYARGPYVNYVTRYGTAPRDVLLVGMNPGPWGMAQTGVPFGTVGLVRDWLGVSGRVEKPSQEHPKRPIDGFACRREEISGQRLWGWARDMFVTPEAFFSRFFVANYCPLVFMESGGRNRTPDRLPPDQRDPLLNSCDLALRKSVEYLRPRFVIGVGGFTEKRARSALNGMELTVGRILHPSPASPAANRGWSQTIMKQLAEYGILPSSVTAGRSPR